MHLTGDICWRQIIDIVQALAKLFLILEEMLLLVERDAVDVLRRVCLGREKKKLH